MNCLRVHTELLEHIREHTRIDTSLWASHVSHIHRVKEWCSLARAHAAAVETTLVSVVILVAIVVLLLTIVIVILLILSGNFRRSELQFFLAFFL